MKVYVAASWRTVIQPDVVAALRAAGHDVYDFRNPPNKSGFGWEQVHSGPMPPSRVDYVKMLHHPIADAGFAADIGALRDADAVVLVQPSGRSAALEFGYGAALGKLSIVLLAEGQEPELMLKVADAFAFSIDDVVRMLT